MRLLTRAIIELPNPSSLSFGRFLRRRHQEQFAISTRLDDRIRTPYLLKPQRRQSAADSPSCSPERRAQHWHTCAWPIKHFVMHGPSCSQTRGRGVRGDPVAIVVLTSVAGLVIAASRCPVRPQPRGRNRNSAGPCKARRFPRRELGRGVLDE